jgi:hypothetical protein
MAEEKVQPVSDSAKDVLDFIQHNGAPHVCLVSTLLDGKPVDVIASLEWSGPAGDVGMTPLAIVVSPDLFDRLADPSLC